MVDLEASMKNQMATMENQKDDFGKQCETHLSTVFSKVDQIKTKHDSLSEFVSQLTDIMSVGNFLLPPENRPNV
ncbi:uncharacterized protein G2W53_027038 [Senna tora]|uniref:Uncharacterized protein n=1 Tax=Senna tora TaxID=362788 RepID=A0A834WI06_9FABA|nr:uncharacterized protein G2W53_027038 [Senna tora]